MESLERRNLLTGLHEELADVSPVFDPDESPGNLTALCPAEFMDVTDDGKVTPLDVVLLVNHINNSGPNSPPASSSDAVANARFDMTGDGLASPEDVLVLINYINSGASNATDVINAAVGTSEAGENQQGITRLNSLQNNLDATQPVANSTISVEFGADHVLRIIGTDDNDFVNLVAEHEGRHFTGRLEVRVANQLSKFFKADEIDKIYFEGKAGDDALVPVWDDGFPTTDTLDILPEMELHGGPDRDTLIGGNANDVIFGGEGADWIEGNGGDDYLCGGPSFDTIDGGNGDNTIFPDACTASLPELRISNASITEGDSGQRQLRFKVTLSKPTTKVVTSWVRTEDGTAKAGEDFVRLGPKYGFWMPAGAIEKDVVVKINGDFNVEGDEQFTVHLSSPRHATIADGVAVGTIRDDEPEIRIANASITEGDSGQRQLRFKVTLSKPTTKVVTSWVRTEDGTAKAGEDFVRLGPKYGFWMPAGATEKDVVVKINGDFNVEGDEQFTVHLSSPRHATIADGVAVGTIRDDDR